MSQIALFMVIM
jgi:hypothetical protein